jgi:quercetin dioxygenase-like cupin family protein
MQRLASIAAAVLLCATQATLAQDVMQFHSRQLKVLAEDDKVRVLDYSPRAGEKTPMHSHPPYVVYVVKGGRVRYTAPDGAVTVTTLTTGQTIIRPATTHADEALDDVEAILVELKK